MQPWKETKNQNTYRKQGAKSLFVQLKEKPSNGLKDRLLIHKGNPD